MTHVFYSVITDDQLAWYDPNAGKNINPLDRVFVYVADVDHFFPHMLLQAHPKLNLNGVWNLVLSCKECNRGEDGKFASIPELYLLKRLWTRNEFFIKSHHPLRETLKNQTGQTDESRKAFLQKMDTLAIGSLVHRWKPMIELEQAF